MTSEPLGFPARTLWLAGVGRKESGPSKHQLPPAPDNPPTISLCVIARGSEPQLPAMLDSVREHVDEIVLVLTGTPDEHQVSIPAKKAEGWPPVRVVYFEWCDDFAAARNESFKHATGDWLFWVDSDDTVEGAENLHALVAEAERLGWGCIQMTYVFRTNDRGQPTVVHNRERLMKRSLGWTWRDRVHEFANAAQRHYVGFSDDVQIVHHPSGVHTHRNLKLLKLMEAQNPAYPRVLVGLADVYFSQDEFDKALDYYQRYFERAETSIRQWDSAVNCARSACKLATASKNAAWWGEVARWCQTAIAVHPEFADPYIYMAHVSWWRDHDAGRALFWLSESNGKGLAPLETQRHPEDYTINRWDVEHRALAETGQIAEALEVVGKALQQTGFDPAWQYYGYLYLEMLNCEKSLAALAQLVDHLCRRGDTLRALKLVEECAPLTVRTDKRFARLRARIHQLTSHVRAGGEYEEFYKRNHGGSDDLNAIDVNLYRMEALDKRLRARGVRRVLDVGCGAGEPALWLARQGYHVVGIDINPKAIADARKRAKAATKMGLISKYQVEFRVGSLETLGPENLGKFDAVVMMELLEHLPPRLVPFYIGCSDDFLKPGGAVFATTPNMLVGDIPGVWEEFPRDHVTEFSKEDLERLLTFPPGKRHIWNLRKIEEPRALVPGFGSWFIEYDTVPEEHAEQPVVIYVGPGLEPWTPDYPDERGLGGSETWAVKVARELRKMGYPVVVYAEAEGIWDGVIYRHHSKYNPEASALGVPPWMLIISRYPQLLNERPNAEHVLFMAHDTDYGPEVTPERLDNCDQVLLLSNWHVRHWAETYPFMGGRRIGLVMNGIDPDFFSGDVKRQPFRFVWSSSPDRGLDYFLEKLWPEIISRHPEAELHVFYGWDNIDRLAASRPWLYEFKARVEQLAMQPGVHWHGRVGQRELAQEMLKSSHWVYPSVTPAGHPWNETFCITAWEAQAAGLVCVVAENGALPERQKSDAFFTTRDMLLSLALIDSSPTPTKLSEDALHSMSWRAAAERLLEVVE